MKSDSRSRAEHLLITLVIFLLVAPSFKGSAQNKLQLTASSYIKSPAEKLVEGNPTLTASSPTNSIPDDTRDLKAEQKATLKKAMSYYNKSAYAEAIPYFKKAIQNDSVNRSALIRLSECYRLTNNLPEQIQCYEALIKSGSYDPIYELYYGRALIENHNAEKGRFYFEKYGTDSQVQDLAQAFGKLKTFKRNSDAYEIAPAVFNSLLNDVCAVPFRDQIIFSSSRPTTLLAKKFNKTGNFDMLSSGTDNHHANALKRILTQLNSSGNETALSFNSDYSKVYITTNSKRNSKKSTDGTYKLRIIQASITADGITDLKDVPFINKECNYGYASLAGDGKTMYFSSDQPGGQGGMDLYKSQMQDNESWGPPINLGPKINTALNELYPFVSHDNKLFFSSDGHEGLGGLDIYESSIHNNEYGYVYNLGEPVNSQFHDYGFYVSPENKGFITSSRHSQGMEDDIYHLNIHRSVKRGKDVLLVLRDKQSSAIIGDSKLLVNGDTVCSSTRGELIVLVEDRIPLRITSLSEDHFRYFDSLKFEDTAPVREIKLEKRPKVFLRGLLTDITTNELLEGVRIKITDLVSGQLVDDYITNHAGDYFKFLNDLRLGEQLNYEITFTKEGYFERTYFFKHLISAPGEINLNQQLNLQLGKIEKGIDLAQMADIEPVYIEAKDILSESEKTELDKIAAMIVKYPEISVEIGTHTDCRRSAISNMSISSAQANVIFDYLVSKGIDKTRLSARGYGESKHLNNCGCEGKLLSDCPEDEHKKNRRTEFIITNVN